MVQDDGLLAEYVHILADSALVRPGDRVAAGQPLCKSGGAGFCPSPHLHLQLQEGEGDSAPTVLFALLDCDGNAYLPVAGKWYGPEGESAAPLTPHEHSGNSLADSEIGLMREGADCRGPGGEMEGSAGGCRGPSGLAAAHRPPPSR